MIESINVKIDEGRLTSSREDSEESDDEEEEGSKKKDMKKIKVEEQPERMKNNSRKMKDRINQLSNKKNRRIN